MASLSLPQAFFFDEEMVEFWRHVVVGSELTESSERRGIVGSEEADVGRIKHLSVRMLESEQKVRSSEFVARLVPPSVNRAAAKTGALLGPRRRGLRELCEERKVRLNGVERNVRPCWRMSDTWTSLRELLQAVVRFMPGENERGA